MRIEALPPGGLARDPPARPVCPEWKTVKILLIDDDELVRYSLSKLLRGKGHGVATAANGARGAALIRTEHPEVVITDIVMPEQEGIETIIAARHDHPEIKIIAISGGLRQGNLDILSMAALLGADAILAKPFEPQQLLALLNELRR
jgi:CheY-like chemotaxis protein